MRMIDDTTEHYLASLTTSLSKDAASLERWRMVHIELAPETSISADSIAEVKATHPEQDVDVITCKDGDIILLSASEELEKLRYLAGLIAADAAKAPEIHSFDLVHDWRQASQLLTDKAERITLPETPISHANFGEIELLKEVFAESKAHRKTRHPMHVMIVEDDPVTRRIVSNSFKENCAIITAENAEEAVANYLLHAPDIVFLDIGLPDVSGFDVLHQLMESDPDAYVVMFSGNGYIDNVTKALNHGAAGFIAKPFKKEKLNYYIKSSAAHHRKSA